MLSLRTFASLGLVALAFSATGCKKDEPQPQAAPEGRAAAAATASLPGRGKLNVRQPMAIPRIDPQVMKEYRADVCYFGTLSIRAARDAYLASLNGAEPGPGKIPSFGGPATMPGTAGGAASGSAAAPAPPPPAASASASGSAGVQRPPPRGGNEPFMRAPHERNARACSVARGLKDPAMPETDAAIQAFADFSIELSKDLANATGYYVRKDYEGDKFAKGKEMHKKLKDSFAKFDELSDKLGAAVDAWHKGHPADASKMDDGQKAATGAFEDARAVMLALSAHKVDPAAAKAAIAKLEASNEALKARAAKENPDAWSKVVSPAVDDFLGYAKSAQPKADKPLDPDAMLQVAASFVLVIEAKQRALSRVTMAKAQAEQASASASASAAPADSAAAPH
jgi:hypothetical protein